MLPRRAEVQAPEYQGLLFLEFWLFSSSALFESALTVSGWHLALFFAAPLQLFERLARASRFSGLAFFCAHVIFLFLAA